MIRVIIFLFASTFSSLLFGQIASDRFGRVVDCVTGEPVPYANITDKTIGHGSVSNNDGFFRLIGPLRADSICISSIGYKDKWLSKTDISNTVCLERHTWLLSEALVSPENDAYLFELIGKCRKNAATSVKTAKAVHELKTFVNGKQKELVESYVNLNTRGYDVIGLNLKAGRIALQPENDRYFVTTHSAESLLMLPLFGKNKEYPISPLNMTMQKGKKHFALQLENKYVQPNLDSVFVISYYPETHREVILRERFGLTKPSQSLSKSPKNAPTQPLSLLCQFFHQTVSKELTFKSHEPTES